MRHKIINTASKRALLSSLLTGGMYRIDLLFNFVEHFLKMIADKILKYTNETQKAIQEQLLLEEQSAACCCAAVTLSS